MDSTYLFLIIVSIAVAGILWSDYDSKMFILKQWAGLIGVNPRLFETRGSLRRRILSKGFPSFLVVRSDW